MSAPNLSACQRRELRRELVLAAIRAGAETLPEIARATGLSREAAQSIRAKLVIEGLVAAPPRYRLKERKEAPAQSP